MAADESAPAPPSQVADGIYRLGDAHTAWYALEDGPRLTIVDAGLPAHWQQLPALLGALGRGLEDVAAVLLTHNHPDHLGAGERIRAAGARVFIHGLDADAARRGGASPPGLLRAMVRPSVARYMLAAMRAGAGRVPHIADLATFTDGERLDVPGRPLVIHTPGHTGGECVLFVEDRGVLFSGDALVTLDPVTGRVGPRLLAPPFVEDPDVAFASLARIEATGASTVLPGHGEPWSAGVVEAVRRARGQ